MTYKNNDICTFCGKTYERHDDYRSKFDAVPKVPCLLLKEHFVLREKTEYEKKMDEILTPEVIEKWRKARLKRLETVKELLADEDELFLEEVEKWVRETLDECYSNYD